MLNASCEATYIHLGWPLYTTSKCALLTHSGEKAHKCTRYNTSFSRTAHLKTHLLTHSGEKPHKCAECNKSFSRAGHLRTHLRTHSGKKPHKSTQCEKSFSQGAHLRTHLLAHSGEKVHMCTECNKSFSQAGDLKKHLLTHSGEKALQSPVCSMQQSIRSSGLLTLWTRPKSQKDGQNYKNTGVRRAFLPKCPSRRANPSLDGRLCNTGVQLQRNVDKEGGKYTEAKPRCTCPLSEST